MKTTLQIYLHEICCISNLARQNFVNIILTSDGVLWLLVLILKIRSPKMQLLKMENQLCLFAAGAYSSKYDIYNLLK
jgi:hypothetical protein